MIMAYKTFEETLPWQKVQDFVVTMYPVFKKCSEESLVSELVGSALNAAAQIAKGHETNSNEEQVEHLVAAKNLLVKCRSMLVLAKQLNLCKESETALLMEKNIEASKVIQGLVKYLRNNAKAA